MSLLIARGCWAGAFLLLLISFLLVPTVSWQAVVFVSGLSFLGLLHLTRGAINGLMLFALLSLIALGAFEQVWIVNLIVTMILGLAGFQFTAFTKRYQFSHQPDPQFEINHLRNVGLMSLGALILSLIGLTIQLELGFWPVLGLGIFLLFTLVMVIRKSQTPPSA